eukprot:6551803-Pyramimonas_sp.AAC.1
MQRPKGNPRQTVEQSRNIEPLPNEKRSFFRAPAVRPFPKRNTYRAQNVCVNTLRVGSTCWPTFRRTCRTRPT